MIANNLQRMGYVGHFDIDAVVDDQEQIYLLEVNARRTGGTHAHELACFQMGNNYLDRVTLLSQNKMHSGSITRFEDLKSIVGDLQ